MSHEDKEKIKNILPSAYTYKFSDLCYKSELKYSTESMYHSDESDWSDFDEPSNNKADWTKTVFQMLTMLWLKI